MFKTALSFLIIPLFFSGSCLAEMRKCVNEAGSVAFTDTLCPPGYSTKRIISGDVRGGNHSGGGDPMKMYQEANEELDRANAAHSSERKWLSSPERMELIRRQKQAFELLRSDSSWSGDPMKMYQVANEMLDRANAAHSSEREWLSSPERMELIRRQKQAFELLRGGPDKPRPTTSAQQSGQTERESVTREGKKLKGLSGGSFYHDNAGGQYMKNSSGDFINMETGLIEYKRQ